MGGTGFSLDIKPIRGSEPAPEKLYEELFTIIADNIVRTTGKAKAYTQVTADYLSLAREDGAGYPDSISFGFRDGAGLCQASVHACYHWFALYLGALAKAKGRAPSPLAVIAERHGLTVGPAPYDVRKLLAKCPEPLVELRGHLFGIGVNRKESYLVSDELDDDPIEIEDLTPKERAKVDQLVKKERCECKVCAALRKSLTVRLPKPKAAAKPKKPPKLGVKTSLSSDKLHRNVDDEDCTELPDGIFAPPSLTGMWLRAGVTTLPDTITKLGALEKLTLYGMKKMTRLPEVLAQMPHVVDLGLAWSAFEDPAGLAKMPWLESLRLERVFDGKIDAIPFAALTKLRSLRLEALGIETIPEAAVTSLRELLVRDSKLATLPPALLDSDRLEVLELFDLGAQKLPSLAKLTGLRRLRLSGALAEIPELPPNLVELEIACAPVTSLPASIETLTQLQKLEIREAKISSLPASIGKLTKLAHLQLIDVPITELPPALGKLDALRTIWLASPTLVHISEEALPRGLETLEVWRSPELTTLPASIGELKDLACIKLQETKIGALPASMRALKKLRTLRVEDNSVLTEIPTWVGDLTELDDLGFEKCPRIGALPDSIRKLKKLTWLLLNETPGAFPLPKWIGELPLERLFLQKVKAKPEDKARLQKMLPNAEISIR